MVGTDVEVVVIGVQGEQVKLGFVAPKNVAIHRKEIYEQIQSENLTASSNINPALLEILKTKN
jgi:carbon storage regulator